MLVLIAYSDDELAVGIAVLQIAIPARHAGVPTVSLASKL